MTSRRLNLVVAACQNRGIGKDGQLPWRLKGDMAHFKKVTTKTDGSDRKNAVIMGRKTWDSIPQKFRPLANRINVIISKNLGEAPEGAHLARSLDEAIDLLVNEPLSQQVEGLFVIGGSSIYQMALASPHCHRIYYTEVLADIKCDTFLPEFDTTSAFKEIQCEDIDSDIKEEGDIQYKYRVYEKIEIPKLRTFNVCTAMVNSSRGIGIENRIPWPSLKKDYQHYINLSTNPRSAGKKNVVIKGRRTWESTCEHEATAPDVINIVISSSLRKPPDHVQYIASSFDEALKIASTPPLSDTVESVWVLGGVPVFQTAFGSPLCRRIYLTRIYGDFECDRFLPSFENKGFQKIRDDTTEEGVHEENGVKFEFEVFERQPSC